MVKITYTGINGKTTSFGVNSPKEAMARLRGIKGYNGGIVDSAAAGLAKGFAARHKNAARVAQLRDMAESSLKGANGQSVSTSPFGVAAKVQNVTGVRMDEDGNLIATTREDYVSQSGAVAAVGKSSEKSVGKVSSLKNLTIDNAEDKEGRSSADVVTDVTYDSDSHQLVASIGRLTYSNGSISIVNVGSRVITTAVEETVVA